MKSFPRTGLGQKPEALQTHINTTPCIGQGDPHVDYVLKKVHLPHGMKGSRERGEGHKMGISVSSTESEGLCMP